MPDSNRLRSFQNRHRLQTLSKSYQNHSKLFIVRINYLLDTIVIGHRGKTHLKIYFNSCVIQNS